MLIGVDFDNTIVCYDELFHKTALERKLIPEGIPGNKGKIRDYLRQTGNENAWTELQGCIYGLGIQQCLPFPGVLEFFQICKKHGKKVFIISHKTLYPARGPKYDLHHAARSWLLNRRFYDTQSTGLCEQNVSFVLTRQEKLKLIVEKGCDYFVDDLVDFFMEPDFPTGVKKVLFDPHGNCKPDKELIRASSWAQIRRIIIDETVS